MFVVLTGMLSATGPYQEITVPY